MLDWESAEVEGLPGLDLLYYLAYASFSADRAAEIGTAGSSRFGGRWMPSSATGAVRRDAWPATSDALGLDPAHLAPLRALVWLIHAHSDFRHAAADAGGAPPAACAVGGVCSWRCGKRRCGTSAGQ